MKLPGQQRRLEGLRVDVHLFGWRIGSVPLRWFVRAPVVGCPRAGVITVSIAPTWFGRLFGAKRHASRIHATPVIESESANRERAR